MTVLAWHFTEGRVCAHDGRPIVEGETLSVDPPILLCSRGLHASERALDALQYAPGYFVWRVECSGELRRAGDKLAAQHRKALWGVDAEALLRRFARWCAIQALPRGWLTPPSVPPITLRYLVTGDPLLREAARTAAWDAVWADARNATLAAAREAAWDAAREAAREAAWAAAVAAREAAWAAAVALGPARGDAASSAAWGAQDATLTSWLTSLHERGEAHDALIREHEVSESSRPYIRLVTP